MRATILAVGLLLGFAQLATAQPPFEYKPIDTNKLLVKPGDAVSGMAAGATTSTFRTITRAVANTIENNGFVRTINNLLGRRVQPPATQAGFSPLPPAGSFQSTGYPTLTPAMPIGQQFGRSAPVVTPQGPSPNR